MKTTQISETPIVLNTIEEAIEDIRNGKVIIVVDDEDRENEGDFVAAAEKITQRLSTLWLLMEEALYVLHLLKKDVKIRSSCNGR